MWGCWRFTVVLISARNRSAPMAAARSGLSTLERHVAVLPEVPGQIDRGHPALTELALDAIAALEGCVQARNRIHCVNFAEPWAT